MRITENRIEEKIILRIEGRIDTNSSAQLQTKILQAFQKSKHLELDFEKTDYITSAGLRALLIGQKTAASKGGSMKLFHVCPMIMNVFNMSGFVKILTIEP